MKMNEISAAALDAVERKATLALDLVAEAQFYAGYSRYLEGEGRYETWEESVDRVMRMHAVKYADKMSPELEASMSLARVAYTSKRVLGAQRALQFGGEQLLKHEAKMYNCSSSYADRPRFFSETMYLLLCGCGVGFSVMSRHISSLPDITVPAPEEIKAFVIPDSIEGWADAVGVLMSSYFVDGGQFPEYQGKTVHFDYSQIRAKGSAINGGFKAPGPEPLRNALERIEKRLRQAAARGRRKLASIDVYDVVCYIADAVLAGGIRRAALICLFEKNDNAMLTSKSGNWFQDNRQRERSNNSAVYVRDEMTREEYHEAVKLAREFGEPGAIFVEHPDMLFNPCVEIGMWGYWTHPDGRKESGFQFCNLVEINGGACETVDEFLSACEAAATLATLQAGYTKFKYLTDVTKKITDREALIGVSITGWMNSPELLFDADVLKMGAHVVKTTNKRIAALIGINQAARTTCVKPSGNASVLLKTASGIHGEHAPMYFRHVRMNKQSEVAKLILSINPKMIEEDPFSSNGTDYVVCYPVVSKDGSKYKRDLRGVKQLEFVKFAQQHWVENGTNKGLCVHPNLRHNVSNTIDVDDWDAVEEYIYENRQWFTGVSLMPGYGDKTYYQSPFQEVLTAEALVEAYGVAAMFASGLIVDGMHAFNDNLWEACAIAESGGRGITDHVRDLYKYDWAVRRFPKFAKNYFGGDLLKVTACLKDVYTLHKWMGIVNTMKEVDFSALHEKKVVDADSLASQACAGGACEVSFA